MRSELVVDALQMAIWRRRPPTGQTIAHSDHGSTYTSWAFGRRLRGAGLLGSMGSIGDCFDNSVAESFFGTLQLELLDEHHWQSRRQLAQAIFEWIGPGTTRAGATATAASSRRSTTSSPTPPPGSNQSRERATVLSDRQRGSQIVGVVQHTERFVRPRVVAVTTTKLSGQTGGSSQQGMGFS
jgi:hypothetical protein